MSEHPVIKVAKREVSIVHSRKPDAGEEPMVNLPAGHVVWLIQQAEQNQELKEALQFYGDRFNWKELDVYGDEGEKAREALEGKE